MSFCKAGSVIVLTRDSSGVSDWHISAVYNGGFPQIDSPFLPHYMLLVGVRSEYFE